jgi:hypothetical protein
MERGAVYVSLDAPVPVSGPNSAYPEGRSLVDRLRSNNLAPLVVTDSTGAQVINPALAADRIEVTRLSQPIRVNRFVICAWWFNTSSATASLYREVSSQIDRSLERCKLGRPIIGKNSVIHVLYRAQRAGYKPAAPNVHPGQNGGR